MKIAFLYEHPSWSDALIQRFRDNGIEPVLINVAELAFDTGQISPDYELLINRVNVMPSTERAPSVVFHTLHFLHWLEQSGVRVINGAQAHVAGTSKAVQNGLFAQLGLDFPAAIGIYRVEDALNAAEQIGYPLIVKPNIGGSGAGVAKYENADELQRDIANRSLDFGVDRTGLVQEYIESDGYIYRVEILGDRLFYAIRQKMESGVFNYCAADGCHSSDEPAAQESDFDFCVADAGARIETFEPADEIVAQVVSVVRAAGADIGGVEYLIDQRTGRPCYYDYNPYSNFVSDGEALLGFSPEQRFVDFIREQMA